jgi:hypothetical protein
MERLRKEYLRIHRFSLSWGYAEEAMVKGPRAWQEVPMDRAQAAGRVVVAPNESQIV